jgi:hypothetical protein
MTRELDFGENQPGTLDAFQATITRIRLSNRGDRGPLNATFCQRSLDQSLKAPKEAPIKWARFCFNPRLPQISEKILMFAKRFGPSGPQSVSSRGYNQRFLGGIILKRKVSRRDTNAKIGS